MDCVLKSELKFLRTERISSDAKMKEHKQFQKSQLTWNYWPSSSIFINRQVDQRFKVEMFLDRTDLSKTVDKHWMERCHVLSRSSRFLAAVLFERGPVLTKKRLKTVKTSLDRQERVIQACQNIRILRHSLSQPLFSMFSHRFSSVFGLFTIVQGSVETRSKVCRPSFKGLSEPFKAVFVFLPSKYVYWWPVWSLIGPTPPKDSSVVQFLQL